MLVPGLTDDLDNVRSLAQFIRTLKNVELVEVLPFHQMSAYKWDALGYEYALKDVNPPTPEQIQHAVDVFKAAGLNVRA